MIISKKLPQFSKTRALLIVAAYRACKFYYASNGEISEIQSFQIKKPDYTDREGFFMKQKQNQYLGSGSVYEQKDFYEKKVFSKTVTSSTEKIVKDKK